MQTRPAALKSRCPACNPLHGGSFSKRFPRARPNVKTRKSSCTLCGGTREVDVETAGRYIGALQEHDSEDFDHPLFG